MLYVVVIGMRITNEEINAFFGKKITKKKAPTINIEMVKFGLKSLKYVKDGIKATQEYTHDDKDTWDIDAILKKCDSKKTHKKTIAEPKMKKKD